MDLALFISDCPVAGLVQDATQSNVLFVKSGVVGTDALPAIMTETWERGLEGLCCHPAGFLSYPRAYHTLGKCTNPELQPHAGLLRIPHKLAGHTRWKGSEGKPSY